MKTTSTNPGHKQIDILQRSAKYNVEIDTKNIIDDKNINLDEQYQPDVEKQKEADLINEQVQKNQNSKSRCNQIKIDLQKIINLLLLAGIIVTSILVILGYDQITKLNSQIEDLQSNANIQSEGLTSNAAIQQIQKDLNLLKNQIDDLKSNVAINQQNELNQTASIIQLIDQKISNYEQNQNSRIESLDQEVQQNKQNLESSLLQIQQIQRNHTNNRNITMFTQVHENSQMIYSYTQANPTLIPLNQSITITQRSLLKVTMHCVLSTSEAAATTVYLRINNQIFGINGIDSSKHGSHPLIYLNGQSWIDDANGTAVSVTSLGVINLEPGTYHLDAAFAGGNPTYPAFIRWPSWLIEIYEDIQVTRM